MSKKIVAVNASPRKGWNTDTLVTEAAKGAEAFARWKRVSAGKSGNACLIRNLLLETYLLQPWS